MTIKAVRDKLVDVLTSAYGFKVVYDTLPTDNPGRFPALLVKWTGSTVETFTFSRAGANQAKRATHKFDVLAIIGNSGQVGATDDGRMDAAAGLISGVNAYSTLQSTVVEAQIESIQPDAFDWNGVVVYGITATLSVLEDF